MLFISFLKYDEGKLGAPFCTKLFKQRHKSFDYIINIHFNIKLLTVCLYKVLLTICVGLKFDFLICFELQLPNAANLRATGQGVQVIICRDRCLGVRLVVIACEQQQKPLFEMHQLFDSLNYSLKSAHSNSIIQKARLMTAYSLSALYTVAKLICYAPE